MLAIIALFQFDLHADFAGGLLNTTSSSGHASPIYQDQALTIRERIPDMIPATMPGQSNEVEPSDVSGNRKALGTGQEK